MERRILQEQPIHAKVRKAHDEAAERLKQVQAERKHLEGTLARMLKGNDDLKVQIGEQKLSDEHLKDIKRMEKEAFVRESIEIGQQIQAACNKVKA